MFDIIHVVHKLNIKYKVAIRIIKFALTGFLVILKITVSASFAQTEYVEKQSNVYHLGAGDVIDISVYGEDDLSRQKYRLPESGVISYPFGEVNAQGLSLLELQKRIADGLRGVYLINPRVSVSMAEYRSFFINGQIANPGAYPYQPGMSVRKAISLAGGVKERASERKIFMIKEGDPDHNQTKIDMDGAIYPGDTVTIGESFF